MATSIFYIFYLLFLKTSEEGEGRKVSGKQIISTVNN